MRTTVLSLALGLLLLGAPTAAPAQTQQEMNQQADADFRQADKELNAVYNKLIKKVPPEVKERLIDAQLAWIKFRDAEAKARAAEVEGGSMYPLLYSGSLASTTRQRTKELQEWLDSLQGE